MYNILTFENGLRLVYEQIPYVKSVAVGIWVGTGSRNETMKNNGVSHFVEHMIFKGTEKRSAKAIAECIDGIGGQINAFTGKECTCYYTKTLDTHIDIVFDLLSDMLLNSKFLQSDVDIEKKVIMEEINMYEDSPEELVHDLLSEISWKKDPLGYSILGTEKTLAKMNNKSLKAYVESNYNPWNTIISVAGNFDVEFLKNLVNKNFVHWKKERIPEGFLAPVKLTPANQYKEKEIEQVHVCIGFDGLEHNNIELYTLLAVNNILGGGMSSRLFQKIREEHGLVYSIYSYPSSYSNGGIFNIYAGMNPELMEKVLGLIGREVIDLKKKGILEDELTKTKEQLKGNYILGLESTSSRMNNIGKSLLLLGKIFTQEEVLNKIDEIDMESVENIIEQVFNVDRVSMAVVGQINKKIDFSNYLK